MTRPNLFSFATSELSQDAFLCWMIALTGSDEPELRTVGQRFIAWLCSASGCSASESSIRILRGPKRQEHKIDITFEAEIDGQPLAFAIEDKTNTSHHGDQLKRYKEALKTNDPVLIYFKTGYHFPEDLKAKDFGYTVIGADDWVEFLDRIEIKNDILADYRTHIASGLSERRRLLGAILTPTGFQGFSEDCVQVEFLRLLVGRCSEWPTGPTIRHGTNMGGTPWAHLSFAVVPKALPGETGEALFHRIDQRKERGKGSYYLSTRQYADVKKSPEAKRAKISRLRAHQAAFQAAVTATGTPLKFSRPAGDNQGANESEIGILFFDESVNTPAMVLECFPLIHRAFVESLAAAGPA